jgi:uncharacterized protein (DUF1778 family)
MVATAKTRRAPVRARISARVPKNVQARLEEAAELSGATVNQFVVQAAVEKADEIIERERVIKLSKRDTARLLDLLGNPAPPNVHLGRALQRRQEFLSGRPNRTAD